jgi:DNA mismatch repair protein MutS2
MSEGRFCEGDCVLVAKLRKSGTVVEVLANNTYRVALASITVLCRHSELSPSTDIPKAPEPIPSHLQPRRSAPPATLDLHGLTVDEATRKLEVWLSEVIMAGMHQVKVVHGLGTGKLQDATHAVLRRVPTVRAFRVSDYNPGETHIYL